MRLCIYMYISSTPSYAHGLLFALWFSTSCFSPAMHPPIIHHSRHVQPPLVSSAYACMHACMQCNKARQQPRGSCCCRAHAPWLPQRAAPTAAAGRLAA